MDNNNTQRVYIAIILIGIILFTAFLGIGILNLNSFQQENSQQSLDIELTSIKKNNELFSLQFNGTRSWNYLVNQVEIGYRFPNSSEIEKTRTLIVKTLEMFEWQIVFHNFTYKGIENVNIIAFPKNSTRENITLFGAHYDTRWEASRDPISENRVKPILGANDGASGVAILLEYAQIFKNQTNVALLFIDAEDQGGMILYDWSYIVGSTEFVKEENLDSIFPNGKNDISSFILFDMIGDWNLNIKKELNSDPLLVEEIWNQAANLKYEEFFVPSPGYPMLDDHIPFLNEGIPAVDLIDFDYYDEKGNNLHHTIRDSLEYVSEKSLWVVGQTLELWIKNKG
jgi:Zn-dependent M28 family amino/carboxypeptidase